MATVNRLKKKKEQQCQSLDQQNIYSSKNEIQSPLKSGQRKTKTNNVNNHSEDKQKQYERYYQINQSNPIGIAMTSNLFPHSSQMNSVYGIPLGFCFSPLIALQNETDVMKKSADRIPKCSSCQAYMNCYNMIDKKNYKCFLCGGQNCIGKDYKPQSVPNDQLNSAIYQAIGPSNKYPKQPTQQVYIFLIDISVESSNTKMLHYAVAAMKQALSRQQLDDLLIYFFTFDETVHEYDFSGEDVRCIIFDPTILESRTKTQGNTLTSIRKKLFSLLDNLEEMSKNNKRSGYNFKNAFSYVYSVLSYTGGRFFILQCSQALASETMFIENKVKEGEEANSAKILSYFQTRNKEFFQKYTENMLNLQCSISFFSFATNYKNLKAIHDCLKLTSSELKYYTKQSPVQLDKFYYDFSYLLGCNYYKNVRVEFILSSGWNFTGVYGNFYRIKNSLIFQINSLQPSRKMFVLVTNSPKYSESSFCCLQIITNYRFKRQSFISIATVVQPVTGFLPKLYASIDIQLANASLAKQFFSALRMDTINNARKKLLDASSKIYLNALQIFKKMEQFPEQTIVILKAVLGMIKSVHSQPEIIMGTPLFDRVISERNFLQFSSASEFATYFNPYLFSLSNLDENMCRSDIQFVYPPSIEVKFQNIKEGLFLLDNGLSLYLFIAQQCDPNLITDVFGKNKITKTDFLTQETIIQQNNLTSSQVLNLIRVLREQKSYGWAPLHIVRCGENTQVQRTFYLNFYTQKYDEFKVYNITFKQFLNIISKPNFY